LSRLGELIEATPAGWHVGRPSPHPERDEWILYAFDPGERPVVGVRGRDWLAKGTTELDVVREMARCLRAINDGPGAEVTTAPGPLASLRI
jgi:hypothetical protein